MKNIFLSVVAVLLTSTTFSQTVLIESNNLVWGKDTLYMPETNVWYLNLNNDYAIYTVFQNEVPLMVKRFDFESISFVNEKTYMKIKTVEECEIVLLLNAEDCVLEFDGLFWLGTYKIDFQSMLKNKRKGKK